ncbi:ABC transporter ATP-binding protein [Thalassovita mediterranea]|jgi:ATP-binding cassette subfamily B protein|uniref:Putative multidrug export ATP-binding/permease protein n=1 Tax=Thalassovita mediterranea TaxID=340021 RepID=A0A0P1GS06_9RHOB|nr:Putative multidrug export ATP-binding/permease protein [Thalassovita mediterranea]SIS31785.1 ATP-binding cassette, subfamily B [Thalassovita mediterranea]
MSGFLKHLNLIDPFKPADGPPPTTSVAFVRWALRGTGPVLFLAFVLASLGGALEATTAYILGRVVDSAAQGTVAGYMDANAALLIAAVLFFILVRPVFQGLSALTTGYIVGPNLNPLVLSRLHRWTMGQSVDFFDSDFAGRIAQKQMQTASALTQAVNEVIHVVAFAAAAAVGSMVLLMAIDWRMAGIFALWFAAYVGVLRYFLPRVRVRSKARAGARAGVTGQVVDTITNIKTVKLFAHADHEDRAALDQMRRFRDIGLAFGATSAAFRTVLMLVGGLLPLGLVGAALYFWSLGQASPGDIVAAGAVSLRLSQMTGWFSFALMGIYSSIGEVEDGVKTLTRRERLEDVPDARTLEVCGGEIALDQVSFAYGRDVGGVSDITLTIKPGEKLGIVGASGAGKSTLVSLLLRLYEAESGAIRIDGQDLRGVTQESLRRQIGMVTQETAMFNRSARDNILYGCPDADEAALIHAAAQAEAHEFVSALRDSEGREGYDAHLGERGVKLSGGQRQRIALARAILKDAPILVLDEATSALDSEVEAAIQTALERVMEGKTVLAIAHRLSTIAKMDRIIVMDQGRIVEQGSHDDLLAARGLYARYWDRQSGGFIGADEDAGQPEAAE